MNEQENKFMISSNKDGEGNQGYLVIEEEGVGIAKKRWREKRYVFKIQRNDDFERVAEKEDNEGN